MLLVLLVGRRHGRSEQKLQNVGEDTSEDRNVHNKNGLENMDGTLDNLARTIHHTTKM